MQQFRSNYFAAHPLCCECEKKRRITLATQLDHIIPLEKGGADFDVDPDNLQGLCGPCHDAKTAKDRGYKIKTAFDVNGNPVVE